MCIRDSVGADDVTVAPFELVNGMIIVQASVNGVLGDFILDTGSPGIVLNSVEHEPSTSFSASGIGGELEIGSVTVEHFKWGIIEKAEIEGFTLDIGHLELATGRKIMGLIGFEVFQQYELLFDYPNNVVSIYNASKVKKYKKKPVAEVPFKMCGHVPVIAVKVGKKKAFLGLDSGAETNLLDDSFLKPLKKSFLKNNRKEIVIGLDQEEQEVDAALLKTSEINGVKLSEMKFLFMDLENFEHQFETRFDGLLGFPFFREHAVSINYKERKIYIWN